MDAPLRRDTLRYTPKNYRLSAETTALLEAIRRSEPRKFLTYEELLSELVRFYLAHQRTIREEVDRYLEAKATAAAAEPEVAAVRVRSRTPETEDPR